MEPVWLLLSFMDYNYVASYAFRHQLTILRQFHATVVLRRDIGRAN